MLGLMVLLLVLLVQHWHKGDGMDSQLLQNQDAVLRISPSVLVTSCSVIVYKPDGAILVGSTSATLDSQSNTVTAQSATNPNLITLNSVSGVTVGLRYIITGTDGQTFQVTVSDVDTSANQVTVNVPPTFALQSGDTFKGSEITIQIGKASLANLDTFYRAEFLCTAAGSGQKFVETVFFDVVRMQFNIKSPELVKRLITFQFPSAASRFEAGMIEEIADRAHKMILDKIRATGRFPHLYGNPDMFEESYQYAVRLVLADFGMIPNAGSVDIIDYINIYTEKLNQAIEVAAQGNGYDSDNDGAIEPMERLNWSTRIVL